MKAIDLYSGVGGWNLGLRLCGIDVIKSFEWWPQAVNTSNINLGTSHKPIDIRSLNFKDLPKDIDIVVGSPPCTQFSYSNRGGSGDIDDGIIDLYKFFECISVLRPKYWAMENVPRVKKVLIEESKVGGQLHEFSKIINDGFIEVLDMSEFGTPQKRKRCIASNVNLLLLNSYKIKCAPKTLGEVIENLAKKKVFDINYKNELLREEVHDLEVEEDLNSLEERMNREMKTNHPVYNNMAFPENLNHPARTITATCTRVSRESLIIKSKKGYRRLSVRERATIQGFPINFNFYGSSHSQKLKMIGNAIPPTFTYALGNAILEKNLKDFKATETKVFKSATKEPPPKTTPDKTGKQYSKNRSFRFSPSFLRFKSGLRFELSNKNKNYSFKFFYGDSKNIEEIKIDKQMYKFLKRELKKFIDLETFFTKENLNKVKFNSLDLQKVWTNEKKGTHPFMILDETEKMSKRIYKIIKEIDDLEINKILEKIFRSSKFFNKKIEKNADLILSGFITTSLINSISK